MKKILCVLMSCMLLVITGCSGHSKNLKFGAADIGGMYYSFASTFTQLADKEIDGYTFETRTTAGSVANLRLISDGYIDLAIDQIVVRNDSGISSVDDLINKTVSVGASESGTEKNAEQILKMSGIADELINKVNMDYTEAAAKLKNGDIDAFFCTAGTRTGVIEQLSKECDISLISLDDKCIDKMLSAYSLCEKYTIPAGTYQGQDTAVTTIGVKAVLIARQSLSDDVIKNVTKTLYEHADDFKYATSLDITFNVKEAANGVDIPFHLGAADYYTENGIKVLTE